MTRTQERCDKLKRLRAAMRREGLDVVFLTTRANFAWLTCGGSNHVNTAVADGVTTLAVTSRRTYVLANAIEAPRMMAEELSADEFTLVTFPWQSDAAKRQAVMDLVGRGRAAADSDLYGLPRVPPAITELRYSLTPAEVARYKTLGRDVSLLLETVGAELSPGETEQSVDGLMAELALAQGIRPLVRLVAADRRIEQFRHPIPTETRIRRRAMIVICGERGGLIVAATRLVNFEKLSASLRRKHEAVCRVDAALIAATQPGRAVGDVLAEGLAAYAREGFAGEWQRHHQGGPTGYAGREFLATPGEARPVRTHQAFAWNPSITGTKSEDTILATESGPVILSAPVDWPTVEVEAGGLTLRRADILVR